jgi:hypothetical protein
MATSGEKSWPRMGRKDGRSWGVESPGEFHPRRSQIPA